MRLKIGYPLSVLMAVVLAACGGGGGGGSTAPLVLDPVPTPSSDVPASTNVTTSGLGPIVFMPVPGGVRPVLSQSSSNRTITWGSAAAISGIQPTVPFSFQVDVCQADPNDLKVVCAGLGLTPGNVTDLTKSSRIAVLDVRKFVDTLQISDIGVQEFDSGAGNVPIRISGFQCITCAIDVDVGKHRFVTAGAGGYRVFNYGSTLPAAVYNIPVQENLVFLSRANGTSYIVAPEREISVSRTRKLRVVDVDAGRVYVWNKNTDSLVDLGSEGRNFQSQAVNAAAVDTKTGMIVLATDNSADFMLIDFGQATFDTSTLTFSAPFAFAKPNPATAVGRLSNVAVSTQGSILLSQGERTQASETGANVGVTQLPTTLGAGGAGIGALAVLDLNDAALDRSPCGAGYVFIGKSQTLGASLFAGIDDGRRGVVTDTTNTCAALIDLVGVVGAPRKPGDPNRLDTTLASVRDMVKFVKLK